MTRLVTVSNRVSIPRRGAAPGGLAVGVLAAMEAHGGLWFGWSGDVCTGAPPPVKIARRHGVRYATIDLTESEHTGFYQEFSNGLLWPVFHYFLDNLHYSDTSFKTYCDVNNRFAAELMPMLRDGDRVWVHDYHLIPLARSLRDRGAKQRLGFFLHIPFPNFEVLRTVPVYERLLQFLLDYDLIGFQTPHDLAAFRGAVQALYGPAALVDETRVIIDGRWVHTDVFPIGVDVDAIQNEAIAATASAPCLQMRDGLLGRKLVIGVDRLDYSKGLVERFKAYEKFLEVYPNNLNGVTYLQIAPLSRTELGAYANMRRELERAAGRTNGRFADTDWTPIRYLNRNFPHNVLMGFLRTAHVGVVTPVRDGMNLVAKEFVASQDPADPGVLILSTLAGAACEMTDALLVNPYDSVALAHAFQAALAMPREERRQRHQAMIEALRRNDIHAWHTRFVNALCATPVS